MAEYFTALGTPFDDFGNFISESYKRQTIDQINYKATGILIMGSMGLGVFTRDCEYYKVAQAGVNAASGNARVFIGVTDTCIGRCKDRIDTINHLNFDGIVATVPYYYAANPLDHINFFNALASFSEKPLYLYDLPAVSKSKISYHTCIELAKNNNIRGIKTGDIVLAADLEYSKTEGFLKKDFEVFYSGLDNFDSACQLGIISNLDGMFAATGPISQEMYEKLSANDFIGGKKSLKKILELRDTFAQEDILPSFTYAMNLLGYEGNYAPDYMKLPSENQKANILNTMKKFSLI